MQRTVQGMTPAVPVRRGPAAPRVMRRTVQGHAGFGRIAVWKDRHP
jgi:hypothetical protein